MRISYRRLQLSMFLFCFYIIHRFEKSFNLFLRKNVKGCASYLETSQSNPGGSR